MSEEKPEKIRMKILCPYCNAVYTAEMLAKLYLAEGSYTTDCVGSKMVSSIDIYCRKCKRLVYRKEMEDSIDYLEWERRGKFAD